MSKAQKADGLRKSFAIQLVRADLQGLLDLINATERNQGDVYMLFAPLLCLFLAEFQKFLATHTSVPAPQIPTALAQAIQESRASIKQAEQVDGYVQQHRDAIALHKREFRDGGRGLRGLLRRALACDMGLCTIDSHLVVTTHQVVLGLGAVGIGPISSEGRLSDQAFAIGKLAGQYVGAASRALGMTPVDIKVSDPLPLVWRDVRSASFLGAIARRIESPSRAFASAILSAVTAVNVAAFVVPRLRFGSLVFAFKIRFVMAFHALSSLQRLKNFGIARALLSRRGLQGLKDPLIFRLKSEA